MKLKGLTKLALSGVALAAVAATLGTSTYAWYVSNSTATVNGLNGSTASSDLGSLMVNQLSLQADAQDNTINYIVDTTTNWTNKITIANSLKGQPTSGLIPVTKGNGTGTNSTSGWHDVANVGVAKANAYGYFMFGAWSTKDTHADVNVGIKNTTTNVNSSAQTAYNPSGLPTGVDSGDTFTQDCIYALKFDFAVVDLVVGEETGNTTTAIVESTAFSTAYKGESAAQFDDYTKLYSALSTSFTHGGNAHQYYKALTAENTTTESNTTTINGGETETSTEFASGGTIRLNLEQNKKKVVLIRYWLDGADTDCFDSCRAQSFELNLKLTAVTPSGN